MTLTDPRTNQSIGSVIDTQTGTVGAGSHSCHDQTPLGSDPQTNGVVAGQAPEPPRVAAGLDPISGSVVQDESGGGDHPRDGSDPHINHVASPAADQWGGAGPSLRAVWNLPSGLHDENGLGTIAETVNDLEAVRMGFANRLRLMTTPKDKPDKDGKCRGLGLTPLHPDVIEITDILAQLVAVEKKAVNYLEKIVMKRHPLGPWIKSQKGLGAKTVGRLLAKIGDPYWNTRDNRPRTLKELWSYCGMGVEDGVAPRRRKDHKVGWSPQARTRLWLIAQAVEKSGGAGKYRELYDTVWACQDTAVHLSPCQGCGGKGKPPAPVGSPLSDNHKRSRRYRIVAKAVLKDMWTEARRLHLAGQVERSG